MKQPDYPKGHVLTVGLNNDQCWQSFVDRLKDASTIEICIDGDCYNVRTVARYQFAQPEYR